MTHPTVPLSLMSSPVGPTHCRETLRLSPLVVALAAGRAPRLMRVDADPEASVRTV